MDTNLIFENYEPETIKVISSIGEKWTLILGPLWKEIKEERGIGKQSRSKSLSTPSKSGTGFVKRYTEKPVEYVWMNDVRDLIDRLVVIHGEENAGNNNFYTEKVGITKMFTNKFCDFIVNHDKGIPYLIRFLSNLPHTFWKSEKHGKGRVNWALNHLPLPEMHIPGYSYCGPFTKVEERLARGDKGINPLDEACKSHDIGYRDHKDLKYRHNADKELQKAAKERLIRKDADFKERAVAATVAAAMYTKRKLGMGIEVDQNGLGL